MIYLHYLSNNTKNRMMALFWGQPRWVSTRTRLAISEFLLPPPPLVGCWSSPALATHCVTTSCHALATQMRERTKHPTARFYIGCPSSLCSDK